MSDLHFEPVEKNNTNPKYIGPGTWNVIHTLAYNATTKELKEAFMKHMTIICNQFPCETCREHSKKYLKENPMSEYLNVVTEGKKLGLFTWTWQFHNAVNYRIGKPILSWDMALHIYDQYKTGKSSDGVCSQECSDPDHKNKKDKHSNDKHDHTNNKHDNINDKNIKNIKNVNSHKPLYKLDKEKRYYAEHKDLDDQKYRRVRNYNEL